jgi:hypothetical protein
MYAQLHVELLGLFAYEQRLLFPEAHTAPERIFKSVEAH